MVPVYGTSTKHINGAHVERLGPTAIVHFTTYFVSQGNPAVFRHATVHSRMPNIRKSRKSATRSLLYLLTPFAEVFGMTSGSLAPSRNGVHLPRSYLALRRGNAGEIRKDRDTTRQEDSMTRSYGTNLSEDRTLRFVRDPPRVTHPEYGKTIHNSNLEHQDLHIRLGAPNTRASQLSQTPSLIL